MATVTAHLIGGLEIGKTIHKEAELRELTANDLIESQQAAEKVILVPQPEGDPVAELVCSPVSAGLEALARQIVRIGDYKGPLEIADLKKLKSAQDLGILQKAAQQLEAATLKPLVAQGRN
jgi:phage FluMu protein gp41